MTPELQIAKVPLVKAPPTVSYIHSCDLLSYLAWSSFVGLTQSLTHSLGSRVVLHLLQQISLAASRFVCSVMTCMVVCTHCSCCSPHYFDNIFLYYLYCSRKVCRDKNCTFVIVPLQPNQNKKERGC